MCLFKFSLFHFFFLWIWWVICWLPSLLYMKRNVQFYEPWIVYIDAGIDSCQPGADVTSPNSCRDVCIKLSTCDHSACGEFYFCAKNLKIVIKSSSKSVALCINCIDIWVKMHGHVQYSIGLVYMCIQNSKWSYCNIYVRS